MRLSRLLAVTAAITTAVLTAALVLAAPATAAEPSRLGLTAGHGHADEAVPLVATLTSAGEPVAGASVTFQRHRGDGWRDVATVTTDAAGKASARAVRSRDAGDNVFRALYDGDGTHQAARSEQRRSLLVRLGSVLVVGGATEVVDERSAVLRLSWTTKSGVPVPGVVRLQRSDSGGPWKAARPVRLGQQGRAQVRVTPRVDTRWRASADAQDWVSGARSAVHRLDNLPPGVPVDYPRAAPRPRVGLPPQARATGRGAHAVVQRIPDRVWRSMTGRSWHQGCPVGRGGLRLLRVNYWGYDGYRYRGEVVAASGAVDNMARALSTLYRRGFPIRSMYRVDRFGWSGRVQGANDYRSMAAGNTSAFNCRWVVNRPGVRSPHSYGRSLDLNTWENPYRSATGLVPNSWWQGHQHPRIAWRSRSHPVVKIMLRNGFHWTYGTGDSQHFDVGGGYAYLARACGAAVCH